MKCGCGSVVTFYETCPKCKESGAHLARFLPHRQNITFPAPQLYKFIHSETNIPSDSDCQCEEQNASFYENCKICGKAGGGACGFPKYSPIPDYEKCSISWCTKSVYSKDGKCENHTTEYSKIHSMADAIRTPRSNKTSFVAAKKENDVASGKGSNDFYNLTNAQYCEASSPPLSTELLSVSPSHSEDEKKLAEWDKARETFREYLSKVNKLHCEIVD